MLNHAFIHEVVIQMQARLRLLDAQAVTYWKSKRSELGVAMRDQYVLARMYDADLTLTHADKLRRMTFQLLQLEDGAAYHCVGGIGSSARRWIYSRPAGWFEDSLHSLWCELGRSVERLANREHSHAGRMGCNIADLPDGSNRSDLVCLLVEGHAGSGTLREIRTVAIPSLYVRTTEGEGVFKRQSGWLPGPKRVWYGEPTVSAPTVANSSPTFG